MRIAYDGVPLIGQRSGIGYYTDQLIQAVARVDRTARCVVLCPWPVNPFRPLPPPSFTDPHVEVPRPGPWARIMRRSRAALGVDASLERLVGPVDVYHGTNYLLSHPVERAKRVVSVHDLSVIRFPHWHPAARVREMQPGLRAAVERADRIIAVSEFTKRDVTVHLGVDPGRVTVVPLAVDPAFRPLPREAIGAALAPLGLTDGSYLLFLGTIEPRKNLGRVLDALPGAGPDVGPLVVAGGKGWGDDAIRPRLAALTRQGRVRLLGYVPDALRVPLVAGARALVYPTLYEGFGLPPLEAMACGTPVVTSDVASLPEVVGDAALLVDPLKVDDIAGALGRVWHDEALRATLRTRGLARAGLFTWDRTARMTLDVYAAAMGA